MAVFENEIWFIVGATLVWFMRPGWRVTIRKGGHWVWETSRIQCAKCPLAATPPAAVVEAMERALREIADLTELSGIDFADKHPALNARLDAEEMENWSTVLSHHAASALADLDAWRAGK